MLVYIHSDQICLNVLISDVNIETASEQSAASSGQ